MQEGAAKHHGHIKQSLDWEMMDDAKILGVALLHGEKSKKKTAPVQECYALNQPVQGGILLLEGSGTICR